MYYHPYTYGYPYYPHYWYPYPVNPTQDTMTHHVPSTNSTIQDRSMRQKGHDYGGEPYVTQIRQATIRNQTFRTAIWTGRHLQVTLMSIPVGEDIGLERHRNVDQFIRIEQGQGFVQMGDRRDNLTYRRRVSAGDAIMIPSGVWHNVTNTGRTPLKLYSIYAPPEHPYGTVHQTKANAMAAEHHHS